MDRSIPYVSKKIHSFSIVLHDLKCEIQGRSYVIVRVSNSSKNNSPSDFSRLGSAVGVKGGCDLWKEAYLSCTEQLPLDFPSQEGGRAVLDISINFTCALGMD
ncbi:hypothetical protein H5410_041650 [Solanum commersonii]|uniref:Uncharacterized protein n=1 Tax=Solanum commersonii TaxID=4109 RepID=A0A9J5XVC1_SOLCO|nr:hypothetical protein H5410_041650 [Solanum commersonii]